MVRAVAPLQQVHTQNAEWSSNWSNKADKITDRITRKKRIKNSNSKTTSRKVRFMMVLSSEYRKSCLPDQRIWETRSRSASGRTTMIYLYQIGNAFLKSINLWSIWKCERWWKSRFSQSISVSQSSKSNLTASLSLSSLIKSLESLCLSRQFMAKMAPNFASISSSKP